MVIKCANLFPIMIRNKQGHNIFSGLSQEEYIRVMNVLKQCILATDLTVYFKYVDNIWLWYNVKLT